MALATDCNKQIYDRRDVCFISLRTTLTIARSPPPPHTQTDAKI
jgi:hypothetical protein